MEYGKADIKIIAEKLRKLRDSGNAAALLVGAGVSISGGIPAANGIIDEIKKQYSVLCSKCEKETYAAYMDLLSPMERRKLIGDYIDKAKINLAHLYLGALVKEKYVDRILTVNFDPLILRSLSLYNIYPAVYDFAASQHFVTGEAAKLSVFYLHGQRDGFVLLNTDEEVKAHAEKLKDVFHDAATKRCWIVAGYSGESDPVFNRLTEIDIYQDKLFWVGYKDNEPKEHVLNNILKKGKYGYYVNGYDADSFFLELARELNLPEPDIISKPFTHLLDELNMLADFTINKEQKDLTEVPRRWVNYAIEGFEEGKGFEHLAGTSKEEVSKDEVIKKLNEIWVSGKYEELTKAFVDGIINNGSGEALNILAILYYNWGTTLYSLAKQTGDESLYRESFEKYKAATEIKKDKNEAYYNWGTALYSLAKQTGDESLYRESFEKYKAATDIKKDDHEAYNNWGNALYSLAKQTGDESLYRESFEKYKAATEIKKDDHEPYYNWGTALSDLAKQTGDESLYRESFEKYKAATDIKKDDHEAYYNWGTALYSLARRTGDESLYRESFEKYKAATDIKKDKHEAYNNWGTALYSLAKQTGNESLYRESFEKYRAATDIKKDKHEAYNNWGTALSDLAKQTGNESLYRESFEKYKAATDIKKDDHEAYYNWGTALYSLAKQTGNESLYRESFEKYKAATDIKKDKHEAYNNWGTALYSLAKQTGDESLYRESFEKYRAATDIKKDKHEAYNNWGTALYSLAKQTGNESLYRESFEKYRAATDIKKDKHEAYYNWGNALSDLAEQTGDESLYRESFEKYKAATDIKKDDHEAYYNWGVALFDFSKITKDKAITSKTLDKAKSRFMESEKISDGSASFNLACLYSIEKKEKEALKWLKKALAMNQITDRKSILEDEDLDNIKNLSEFKELLDKYLPEK